jgi:invasion protein IalB
VNKLCGKIIAHAFSGGSMRYLMSRSLAAVVLAGLAVTSARATEDNLSVLIYSPWTKFCLAGTCFVGSDGRSIPDCAPIVSAVLIDRLGESKKTLHVTLPPRVNTERGVRIIIDQSEPIERPYASCRVNGCMAEYDAGPELLVGLKNGRILALEAVDKANSPISVAIPLVGFAHAYDGAPQEPMVFETTQEKLQAEIKERDARCEAGQSQ